MGRVLKALLVGLLTLAAFAGWRYKGVPFERIEDESIDRMLEWLEAGGGKLVSASLCGLVAKLLACPGPSLHARSEQALPPMRSGRDGLHPGRRHPYRRRRCSLAFRRQAHQLPAPPPPPSTRAAPRWAAPAPPAPAA